MPLRAGVTISIQASDIAGCGTARTLFGVANEIIEFAEGVRVNARTALALSHRVSGMVEVIASLEEQLLLENAETLMAFRRVLLEATDALRGMTRRSYLSQLFNYQHDKDTLLQLSERTKHAFQVLMMQLRIQTSVMAQALETQLQALAATSAIESEFLASSPAMPAARIPPNPSLHFGRDSETDAVVNALTGASAGRVAILGGPGIGKTSLALAVLHHRSVVERFGSRRFFVPCDASEGHSSCLTAIAEAFGIVSPDAKFLQRQLLDTIGGAASVIVLDNFESCWEPANQRQDAEAALRFLDSLENLSLVLTLRGAERPAAVRWTKPFLPPLAPLSEAAAKQTFHSIAEIADDDAGAALGALLGRLDHIPLAIVLMANLAQVESAETLLRRWDTLETAMLVRGNADDRLSSLNVSITLSLQSPRMQSAPTALHLLSLLALLPCGVVDTDINLWNIPQSARALAVLSQNSLVLRSTDKRIYVLAPIRSFMLTNHRPSEMSAAPVFDYFFGLAQLSEQISRSSSNARVLAVLAPELANIDSVIRYALEHCPDRARAAIDAVSYLCTLYKHCGMGRGPELLPIAIRAAKETNLDDCLADLLLQWSKLSFDMALPGNERTLLGEARCIYERLGNIDGIIDCSIRLVRFLSPKDGILESRRLFDMISQRADPLRLARCAQVLADSLQRDGNLRESSEQHETAISILQQAFGAEDQDKLVGISKHRIGANLILQGDLKGAIKLLQEALSLFDASHYAQGAQALRVQLADLLSVVGRPKEAAQYADQVLVVDTPGAGSLRIHTRCLLMSAVAHATAGDIDAANEALQKVDRLELAREPIPGFHCQALIIRSYLALLRGDCTEARLLLGITRDITRRKDLLRRMEEEDVHCLSSLSEVECAAGNREEALILATAAALMFRRRGDVMNCVRCLLRLAEAVDDDFAERVLDAAWPPLRRMGLDHELAILLLRSSTIALNRGWYEVARKRARNAVRYFGEAKGDWRLGLAREIAGEE